MIFTPTFDNLSERSAFTANIYNSLIDDIQAKTIVAGDFTYPVDFTGSFGFNGSSLYNVGNFGSDTSANANGIRIANGLGFTPGGIAADNTTSFQTIIDGLSTRGSIMLGPGIYDIDATILLNGSSDGIGNYTLWGQGIDATVIRAAAGFSGNRMLQMTATPASSAATSITLRDMTIDCNSLANLGIDIGSTTDCTFINVRVTGSDSTALNGDGWLITNSERPTLINCRADTNDGAGFRTGETNGINDDVTFLSCISRANTGNGWDCVPSGVNLQFGMCQANGNAIGFNFEESTSDSTMVSFFGCRARDNSSHGYMLNQATSPAPGFMNEFAFTGCFAYSNTGNGFHLFSNDNSSADIGIGYVSFTGCHAYLNDGHGCYIEDVADFAMVGGCYNDNDADSSGGEDGVNINSGIAFAFTSSVVGVNASSRKALTQDRGIYFDGALATSYVVDACSARDNVTDQFTDDGAGNATTWTTQDPADGVANVPAF